jgi:dTDP-4-dehydrorhamnose 3,5-epimerase
MKLLPTRFKDVFIVDIEPVHDHRGFFARTYCEETFCQHGLTAHWVQTSISYNHKKGTLRGLHYQTAPYEEAKLVRCLTGSLFDVIVDIRQDSETYGQWLSVELSAEKGNSLYIPKGFAHGFQTLADHTEVLYYISERYVPEASTGIYYQDPDLNIPWPISDVTISEKDRHFPKLSSIS